MAISFRVIREQIGLTGTKYGCGIGRCGACIVHIDGKPIHACGLPVAEAAGARITTIEGLSRGDVLYNVQRAWIDNDVPQCGYCQPGMIMAVAALLDRKPKPTDATSMLRSPPSAAAARSSRCARRFTCSENMPTVDASGDTLHV